MPPNYSTPYRGLPSELRLIIWQYVLNSSIFYDEIVFESTRANRPRGRSSDEDYPAFLPQSCLNILHLNRETRNEAYGFLVNHLAGTMILDLSHLRRSEDLARFLNDLPTFAYDIVGETIIDYAPSASLPDRQTCAAEKEKDRLNDLINKALHLRCLIYLVDARNSLEPRRQNSFHSSGRMSLDPVWSPADTSTLLAKVAEGTCQSAKLYIRGDPRTCWRPMGHAGGNLKSTRLVKVERIQLTDGSGYRRERGPWELAKYDFLEYAQDSPFAVFEFKKH